MVDRWYPPYTKNFYNQINEEIERFKNIKEIKKSDIDLIRLYLKNIESAFELYRNQIEIVLKKLEVN